ncbi:UvrD-helicase domain-containing protein [Sulfuriflexus mobilis]|uniref:UvrD-helicase domain-containing protein n=1 Tax=Sulfuriflexus mobilis TaxID=1811807 RepID=UPI000F818461|nr:UvrD-helicase domain-containing protein [Sulfuriflexus mobilis]
MKSAVLACQPQQSTSVHASAGSGKTWLLVSRLLRLLLDGTKPDAVLAITFTRKAAAEMQERLLSRLYELACMEDADLGEALQQIGLAAEPEHLETARQLYEKLLHNPRRLNITTFHAFSQQILRRFAFEADVPAGFELIDKTRLLETEAWDALFREVTAQPDSAVAQALDRLFQYCGGIYNTRQALDSFLQHRSEWWALTQAPQDPDTASLALAEQLAIDPTSPPDIDAWLGQHRQALHDYATLTGQHKTATHSKRQQALYGLLESGTVDRQWLNNLQKEFFTANGTLRALKSSKALEKSLGDAGVERLLYLHTELAGAIEGLNDQLARQHTFHVNQDWFAAGQHYLEHYQRIKQQQRLLDFTDLEWRACQLLNDSGHAHWVQYKLDQRIDHLLVDEFQDTNPTQWRLLLPLLQELAAGENERQRSVFIVGDAKQSIYGFRRADASLFSHARGWLEDNLQAATIPLAMSWRSAPVIMDFVNHVFSEGELHQRLVDFSPHGTHRDKLWGRVEFLPVIRTAEPELDALTLAPTALRNPLLRPRELPTNSLYEDEARIIAEKIAGLVEQRTPIEDNGRYRPADYGDIMLLLRNRTHIASYERALQAAGIPYQGSEPGSLLETVEVQDMLALLDTLIAPYNNLSLARVLRCPLFACSEQDLVVLATKVRQTPQAWFSCLAQLDDGHSANLLAARDKLTGWHEQAGHVPVHDLLDRIYSEADVLNRFRAAFPTHLQGRVTANLMRFLELALEIDSGRYPSLAQFRARLAVLRKQERDGPDPAPSLNQGQRVQILTIHSAKGLEAPIVFIADTASVPSDRASYQAHVHWPSGAERPQHIRLLLNSGHRDSATRALLEAQVTRDAREEANLLYVAMTRARQLLYISAVEPARNKDQGWHALISLQLQRLRLLDADGACLLESLPRPALDDMAEHDDHDATDQTRYSGITPPTEIIDYPLRHKWIAPSESIDHSPAGSGDELRQLARLRGTIIHRLFDALTQAGSHAEDVRARCFREFSQQADMAFIDSCWQEVIGVLRAPQHTALFSAHHYQQAWNEVPILYQDEDSQQTVSGIIDRLIRYDGRLLIVDYKTRRLNAQEQPQQLAQSYRAQLDYYARGIKKCWPDLAVEAGILFTAANQFVKL